MPKSTESKCPDCLGIEKNPKHYTGKAVTQSAILRCVLYEGLTLAITIQLMKSTSWPQKFTYKIPRGTLTPSDSLMSSALLKFRMLYEFLYESPEGDSFSVACNFPEYYQGKPLPKPAFVGRPHDLAIEKPSVNKFVAHLTKARITKPKCIPQPKFGSGQAAAIANAEIVLGDLRRFTGIVVEDPRFSGLDNWGQQYLNGLDQALSYLSPR